MTWNEERKPDTEDLLKAIDKYVRAKSAKLADEKRVDEGGGRLNWEVTSDLSEAIKEVGETLNSLIDQRVETRLWDLGLVPGSGGPYET